MTKRELRKFFDYRQDGALIRILAYTNAPMGQVVRGSLDRSGYRIICFKGIRTTFSRAVYSWHHGVIRGQVDHIDGNPDNNRIENLRDLSPSQNCQAHHKKTRAASGIRGLYWIQRDRCWAGMVCAGGVKRKVTSVNKEVAVKKLAALRKEMHGQFASP